MLEQKIMDKILKMRIKNVIVASLKTYENNIYYKIYRIRYFNQS